MKLDRNAGGGGKYAIVKLRKIEPGDAATRGRIDALRSGGFVEMGNPGDENEFFVVKLKDKYAGPALMAYAEAALADDPEYAIEVMELAARAVGHPHRKKPD